MKPKQSLGQNFLVDDNIARKIARELLLEKDDILIEIGSGLGALTRHLTGCVRHLVLVEIDRRVIDNLHAEFSSSAVTIVNIDFLHVQLSDWEKKYGAKLRIIGNIPYHLTSAILFKAFQEHSSVRDLTIMVQQEVGRRIIAKPSTKDYGILSVFSHFYGEPKILFTVSPNCFYPKPKVVSAVVRLKFHKTSLYHINIDLFSTIVHTTFGKRRKTLRNGLKYLPFDEAVIQKILKETDFPLEMRPEQLGISDFAELTQKIERLLS